MRQLVVAGFVVIVAAGLRVDTQVIALVDPADPVLITNATLEFEDGVRPMVTLELENNTASAIETRDVWLARSRFFTKAEAAQSRKIWDCSLMSSASEPSKVIPAGQRAVVRVWLTKSCELTREHEHFFVHVTRVTNGNGAGPLQTVWTRDSGEFARLLTAAQPHP
jgi:hypothetical protein